MGEYFAYMFRDYIQLKSTRDFQGILLPCQKPTVGVVLGFQEDTLYFETSCAKGQRNLHWYWDSLGIEDSRGMK